MIKRYLCQITKIGIRDRVIFEFLTQTNRSAHNVVLCALYLLSNQSKNFNRFENYDLCQHINVSYKMFLLSKLCRICANSSDLHKYVNCELISKILMCRLIIAFSHSFIHSHIHFICYLLFLMRAYMHKHKHAETSKSKLIVFNEWKLIFDKTNH